MPPASRRARSSGPSRTRTPSSRRPSRPRSTRSRSSGPSPPSTHLGRCGRPSLAAVVILQKRVVHVWRIASSIGPRFHDASRKHLTVSPALLELFTATPPRAVGPAGRGGPPAARHHARRHPPEPGRGTHEARRGRPAVPPREWACRADQGPPHQPAPLQARDPADHPVPVDPGHPRPDAAHPQLPHHRLGHPQERPELHPLRGRG